MDIAEIKEENTVLKGQLKVLNDYLDKITTKIDKNEEIIKQNDNKEGESKE